MKKTTLSHSAVSQLERSLGTVEVIDISNLLGISGKVLAIDPSNSTITGTHKGWSYAGMILGALKRGDITEKTLIREFTSGRGGEAAAKIAKLLGLPCEIVMPENITPEREALLRRYSDLILTPECDWLLGSMNYAYEATGDETDSFLVNQSANEDNIGGFARVFHNALSLASDTSFLVSTVGTGGTTAAFGNVRSNGAWNVGVDPFRSPSTKALKEGWLESFKHQSHKYWGGGAGAASPIVIEHVDVIDDVRTVDWETALDTAKWLGEKGLRVGLSTGGNMKVAMDLISENPGATVMTIIHDMHEAYRSMGL